MKNFCVKLMRYIMSFAAAVLIFVLLLCAAALVPQDRVAANIAASLPGLAAEGTYPRLKEGGDSAMLDNFTDSLIIMETLKTDSSDMSTVFSNPLYLQKEDPLESLIYLSDNPQLEPDGYYVRYWMGFRATLRPLFALFTYSRIRHISFGVLVLLTALCALSVAKRLNVLAAASLVLSVVLMRPLIIGRSFQFATCFLVALAALLFIPRLNERKRDAGIFFMLVGMVTQYMDFYTVPVLTLCLPMLYLLSLKLKTGETMPITELLRCILCWFAGYVGSWIVKLLFSSAFTEVDGIENGFSEFLMWMTRKPSSGSNKILTAYTNVWKVLCPGLAGAALAAVFLAALIVCAILRLKRNGKAAFALREKLGILITTALPLIWYAAAATPTANHAFFQYRSAAAVIWGLCLFVSVISEKTEA